MSERLQTFHDSNKLIREWEFLVPVTLLLAEDCAAVDVRYGINDYSYRANNVELNHGTPQMSFFAEGRGSIEPLEFWRGGWFTDRLAG